MVTNHLLKTTKYFFSIFSDKDSVSDIAVVISSLFKRKFRCSSHKHHTWYEFKHLKWEETEKREHSSFQRNPNGTILRSVLIWFGIFSFCRMNDEEAQGPVFQIPVQPEGPNVAPSAPMPTHTFPEAAEQAVHAVDAPYPPDVYYDVIQKSK